MDPDPRTCPNRIPCCERGDLCTARYDETPSEHCIDLYPNECPRMLMHEITNMLLDKSMFPDLSPDWFVMRNQKLALGNVIGQYMKFPKMVPNPSFLMAPHIFLGEIELAIDAEPDPIVRTCIQRRYHKWLSSMDRFIRSRFVNGNERPVAREMGRWDQEFL